MLIFLDGFSKMVGVVNTFMLFDWTMLLEVVIGLFVGSLEKNNEADS